jgi:hypothetical protein
MYILKKDNKNINKIIEKYENHELKNFIIISKIKKYTRIIKEFNDYKTNYFRNYQNIINDNNTQILTIQKQIQKENNYSNSITYKLEKIEHIYINIHLDIVLLNYSNISLYSKLFINQIYKYKHIFFKNKNISLLNINILKSKYRKYILDKTKESNQKKKQLKLNINSLQSEINILETKIIDIRKIKNELYKKNNICNDDNIFDSKEIYDLNKEISLKTKEINKLQNTKIVKEDFEDKDFEVIDLDIKQKLILPIINNNNKFHYHLQQIFIRHIKKDIKLSKQIIDKYNEKLVVFKKENEKYISLVKSNTIDYELKNKYENKQYDINKLESEIIKDYIVLNKK